MSMQKILADAFRPEERRKGQVLLHKNLVVISSASDTDVRAFVKSSTACKVSLRAEEVAGSSLTADCSCPMARKGQLCKHVWAVLLQLESRDDDFLQGKLQVHPPPANSTVQSAPLADARREQQKERQKEWRQKFKQEKKRGESPARFSYPEPVQEALDYFKQNGFEFDSLDLEQVTNAKKLLSRVFHPDKGGTHEEALILSENFQILRDYLKS